MCSYLKEQSYQWVVFLARAIEMPSVSFKCLCCGSILFLVDILFPLFLGMVIYDDEFETILLLVSFYSVLCFWVW